MILFKMGCTILLSNAFSEGERILPVVLRLVLQGAKVDVVEA